MKASHLCPREQQTKAVCPIGNPFYVTSLFVHRLAISKFKLEVKSGNTQLRSKVTTFVPCDLTFDRCLWQIWHLFYGTWSFVHHSEAIWNSIRAGVIVRKCPDRGKICFVLSGFDLWPLTFFIEITFANGNYSWKRYDVTVTRTLLYGCDGWKDGHKDGHDAS